MLGFPKVMRDTCRQILYCLGTAFIAVEEPTWSTTIERATLLYVLPTVEEATLFGPLGNKG